MSLKSTGYRLCQVSVFAIAFAAAASALAQETHQHTPGVSGMPQGIPYFCANPTVTSVAGGAWSSAETRSTHKVLGPRRHAR
jgi:hypothetical protein